MRFLPLIALLGACAHEAPLSTDAPFVASARVSGAIVVPAQEAPGNTFVLIYDAATPPPPIGVGRPFTFSVVPADSFRASGVGPSRIYEAPFDMSLGELPPGVDSVLVTALVDMDDDFYPLPPFSDVSAGATCGDLSGAHITDLASGSFAPVPVEANAHAEGVTVLVGRTATLERPVFEFLGGSPRIALDAYTGVGLPPTFTLRSTGVDTVFLDDDGEPSADPFVSIPVDGACPPNFAVTGYDLDQDGIIDPHPVLGASFRNVWPRVLGQYLGPIDPDTNAIIAQDPSEERWSAEFAITPAATWFGEIPRSVSPAAPTIDPRTEIEVAWVPAALATDPVTGESRSVLGTADLDAFKAELPRGAWSITVINVAGQTWTVPNYLPRLDPAGPEGPLVTQRAVLIIE